MRQFGLFLCGLLISTYASAAIPDRLAVKADMIYPEGIAFSDKTSTFYVSSLRKGTIGAVDSTGKYTEFSSDNDLVSSVGMWVDQPRNRLLACVSDPGVGLRSNPKTKENLARLVAFDLDTKKKLRTVNLGALKPGKHFCNDLTVDAGGNIYLTDSFAPVIYKVTPDYKASVFLTSDKFKGEGFNLNGIVFHDAGYLLVAKYNDGTLWKVPLKDPKKFSQVKLTEPYSGLDGLVLISKDEIIGIQNEKANKVLRFKTSDEWVTATTVQTTASELRFPTTGVKAGSKVYVLEGKLDELFADPTKAASSEYAIKGFSL